MIDWHSKQVLSFFNPRFPEEQKKLFLDDINHISALENHIILSTSGSQAQKWVSLSKTAMLESANSVNQFLEVSKKDIWIKSLPNHHVGGLSIYARAFLSQSKVFDYSIKWHPARFTSFIQAHQGTLTSLVPAQVYDLVKANLRAPRSLRQVIIGGGKLSPSLYAQAHQLGWPLILSYGLTECCSQVATAKPTTASLHPLPHVQLSINHDQLLTIKSPALLSCYITIDEGQLLCHDPKVDGWFVTEDLALLQNGHLTIIGRKDRQVKILGELVNLAHLELLLEEVCIEFKLWGHAVLTTLPDERCENKIGLVMEKKYHSKQNQLVEAFNKRVLPFEQIKFIKTIEQIPKSPLGKVQSKQLHALCETEAIA
ncbi:MAG: AMP-binding protein [Parachlamydiaceae bacterium]